MIPKIIVQSSRASPPENYVRDKFSQTTGPEWKYVHFNDIEILDYFKNHPLEEFPMVTEKFLSFSAGAHRCDLFRYYFLYQNGGVYIDTDAMIQKNINYIVEYYDFFTVNTVNSELCFQGFIGACPLHPILHQALFDIYYNINQTDLENYYHLTCKNFYTIVKNYDQSDIKLLVELEINDQTGTTYDINDLSVPVLIHYWRDKIIPRI
jgi:mannosyltransferase OCH1-like enzyme